VAISIGDALLKVGVDKKDFDRDMSGIGASIKKHQKAIGIGMVAVGAAVLGVATKSVLSFAAMGDEIAKMAKRTGFTTEALSELRYAAELSGASLAGIEKASRTLSGAILDAGYGLETYTRAFDQIGLSYEQLKALSPEEQFLTVMEALAGVEDASTRAALAADLMGRAGTGMLPMLSDGAEGLEKMRAEAHGLGLVFDEEASIAAEKLTDAMTNVKGSITGAGLAIAEALIPIITPLIDKVTEVIKKVGEFAKNNETLTKVITGAGGLLIGLGSLLLILPKIKTAVIALSGSLKTLMLNPIVALIAGLGMLGYGIYSLIKHHTDWNKVVEASEKVNEELAKSEGKLTKEVLEAQRAYNELRIGYGQLEPAEAEQIARSQELIALYDEGKFVLNETTGEIVLLTEATQSHIDAIMAEADILHDKAVKAREEQNKELEREIGLRKELMGLIAEAYPTGLTMEQLQRVAPIIEGVTVPGQVPGTAGYYSALGIGEFRTANINVQLDGKTIAKAVGQPLVDEIRVRTGARM